MGKTSIEWADFTINPIRARNIETGAVGHFCEKCSPECANCYASDWNERVRPSGKHLIGTGLSFLPVNRPKVETFLDRGKLAEVLRRKKPTRFFWCDMTDLFGEWVTDEMIDACFAVMALTPHHTHMVLTKRADRMRLYFSGEWHRRVASILRGQTDRISRDEQQQRAQGYAFGCLTCGDHASRFLPNVQLGVSAGNQTWADKRIPDLLQTPAAVRFLSAEPLLGPIDLGLSSATCSCCPRWSSRWVSVPRTVLADFPMCLVNQNAAARGIHRAESNQHGALAVNGIGLRPHEFEALPSLDLVIDGGESGPRLSHPDWFRSLRDQCRAAGVDYFHKQNGDWSAGSRYDKRRNELVMLNDGRAMTEAQYRARYGQTPDGNPTIMSFARNKGGRLLDGREWNELPEARR